MKDRYACIIMKENYPLSCGIVMDEAIVWLDMVGNTIVKATDSKDLPLIRSTGNETVRISVCLTAKYNAVW